jgi:cell division protein FtsN
MPKLNLRDDGFEEDNNPLDTDQSVSPPPTLREVGVGGGGAKTSTLLTVLAIVAALLLSVFALNYFKVIHLWGKKAPKVTIEQDLPAADLPVASTDAGGNPAGTTDPSLATPELSLEPSTTPAGNTTAPASSTPTTTTPTTTTKPEPTRKFVPPPSGSGTFTVQVSSWTSKARAEREAQKLSTAGMSSFVEDAVIAGENWYRVRVGRYGSSQEAKAAATELAKSLEGRIWVAKVSSR